MRRRRRRDRLNQRLSMLGVVEDNFIHSQPGRLRPGPQGRLRKGRQPDDLQADGGVQGRRREAGSPRRSTPAPAAGRHDGAAAANSARGLLMARRLVEAGVPFVEVDLGGWDLHNDVFNTLQEPTAAAAGRRHRGTHGRPEAARHAERTRPRLDGRIRPHAADQPERRPRPLGQQLVGDGRRRRTEGGPGGRRDRQGRPDASSEQELPARRHLGDGRPTPWAFRSIPCTSRSAAGR